MLPEHGKQKVTDACQSCHRDPHGPPVMSAIPYLNRLFKNVDGGRHPGVAWGDLDNDGKVDLFIANRLNGIEPKEADAADRNTAVLRLDVEQAGAVVRAAEAEVAQVRQVTNPDSPVGHDLLNRARAKLAAAQAALHAAQQRLKEAEAAADRRRVERHATEPKAVAEDLSRSLDAMVRDRFLDVTAAVPSDAEFLRRVLLDLTGTPPTTVEEKYFAADTDPKKREKLLGILLGKSDRATGRDKLLNELLADPEVQKRWAELQQQRIYAEHLKAAREAWASKKSADRLDRLLTDLLERKESDEQVLHALCLATMARYPTETERKLILEAIKAQKDRAAAWQGVLRALAATEEAKAYAAELGRRGVK
jgi:hypothetical protein